MSGFQGRPSAADTTRRSARRREPTRLQMETRSFRSHAVIPGVRGNAQMWAADLLLRDHFTPILHLNPFNLHPPPHTSNPHPAGSPDFLFHRIAPILKCTPVDERRHYYLHHMHHFRLQPDYFPPFEPAGLSFKS